MCTIKFSVVALEQCISSHKFLEIEQEVLNISGKIFVVAG